MRILLAALVLSLATAAGAPAATVRSAPGDPVWFSGSPGVDDVVGVEVREDVVILRDETDELTVTGDCAQLDAHAASCPRRRHFLISLEDGDDRLVVDTLGVVEPEWRPPGSPADVTLQIDGGTGDDVLQGGGLNESLNGRAGADVVRGGPGVDQVAAGDDSDADRIEGEGGRDYHALGGGADVAVGGEGDDWATFGHDVPVTASLDGVANDGRDGQGANLLEIERLGGSTGPDTLLGSPGHDQLSGNGGDDVIAGAGGDDHLWGGDGADRIDGGDGSDTIDLSERDGRVPDHVTCGASRDAVHGFGAEDVIDRSCENALGDPWGWPRCGELACPAAPAPAASPPLRFATTGRLHVRARRAVLAVTCRGPATCRGRLTLERGRRPLAKASLALAPGARRVRVTIPRSRWRRVPRRGDVVVRAVFGGAATAVRLKRR